MNFETRIGAGAISEKLNAHVGEPLVVIEPFEVAAAIGAHGINKGAKGALYEVAGADSVTRSHLIDRDSLYLTGYDELDHYVESALESYEQGHVVNDGLNAVAIAHMFEEHYGEIPPQMCDDLAAAIIDCRDEDTLSQAILQLSAAPPLIGDLVIAEVRHRLSIMASYSQVHQDILVSTYIRAESEMSGQGDFDIITQLRAKTA